MHSNAIFQRMMRNRLCHGFCLWHFGKSDEREAGSQPYDKLHRPGPQRLRAKSRQELSAHDQTTENRGRHNGLLFLNEDEAVL